MREVAFKNPDGVDEQPYSLSTKMDFDLVRSPRGEIVLTPLRPQPMPAGAGDVLVQKISESLTSDPSREVGSGHRVVAKCNPANRMSFRKNDRGSDAAAPHAQTIVAYR